MSELTFQTLLYRLGTPDQGLEFTHLHAGATPLRAHVPAWPPGLRLHVHANVGPRVMGRQRLNMQSMVGQLVLKLPVAQLVVRRLVSKKVF